MWYHRLILHLKLITHLMGLKKPNTYVAERVQITKGVGFKKGSCPSSPGIHFWTFLKKREKCLVGMHTTD